MANIITGDKTKGIKYVGELALRISRFDSYRLFTLYENAKEKKPMDVSGSQKYYLVFRSPSKEIRIPEYDPKGFFEVDKINGCVLFKITKKNAEDILSMKTGGKKIFHIIRVFEETDEFGRVLNVTDEVEVYHGRWGDDDEFMTITTEAKVDLLTKSLAEQIEKNAELLNSYKELLENYNSEVEKTSNLEKESEALRAEVQSLETQLNEYIGDTYDGTILSTDTKYIAFENTLPAVESPSLFFLLKPQRSLKSFIPLLLTVFAKASRVMYANNLLFYSNNTQKIASLVGAIFCCKILYQYYCFFCYFFVPLQLI